MAKLNPKNWGDLTRTQREILQHREWDMEALTVYSNLLNLYEAENKCKDPYLHTSIRWARQVVEDNYEDQIGHGQHLMTENSDNAEFMNMLTACEFTGGRELTGNLEDWLMETDNEYKR